MTDQELWERAVSIVRVEYENLSDPVKVQVLGIGEAIRQNKLEMYALAGGADVVGTCADCGGLCCEKGKYHFSAIDLLMYLSTGKELFTPSFRGTPCPFLGEEGCLMDPAYRPFTCITFHCERLEVHLSSIDLERMRHLERGLRALCREMEELFGKQIDAGASFELRTVSPWWCCYFRFREPIDFFGGRMVTTIHDLVSIHIENKPAFFARIEDIVPDVKPGWWKVSLLVLTNPLQIFTWILEEGQINGAPFTMGGTPIMLEKIVSPLERDDNGLSSPVEKDTVPGTDKKESAKVVSLIDRKKEK